jgi:hypothetical protein
MGWLACDLWGTMQSFFRFGSVRLKDASGVVQCRTSADTDFVPVTCQAMTQNPSAVPSVIANTPHWLKVSIPFSTLASAGVSTHQANLLLLPPGCVVHGVRAKHSIAFAGGTITSYTVSVGPTGTPTKYSPAFNVFQAVSNAAYLDTFVPGSESAGASVQLIIQAVSGGDTLDHCTSGSVDVWLLLSRPL